MFKMKNIFFSIAICLTTISCLSQEFAPIGATWTYTQFCLSTPYCGFITLTSIGDTIIQGHQSSIILTHSIGGDTGTNPPSDSTIFMYGENKRIYIYDGVYNEFKLLYDFNLNVGDTLTIKDSLELSSIFPSYCFFQIKVDSIGSMILGNDTLITQYTTPSFFNTLNNYETYQYPNMNIERIGNVSSLLGSSTYILLAGYEPILTCYNDSNINYGNSSYCITELTEEKYKEVFSVFPTIFSDQLNITGNISKSNTLSIRDCYGHPLYVGSLSKTDIFLDLSFLNNGLYILTYTDGITNNKNLKIIKQ